ncbi:MAG: porin [Sutterella wadsworthensis]
MQMFKKSLAAVAVLGAFAGSALAADVQLYGLVDLGLNWTQVDRRDHDRQLRHGFRSELRLSLRPEGHGRSRQRLQGWLQP